MTLQVWLAYVGMVLVLMSTPGLSHLLMLSVCASNGFQRSLATAAGVDRLIRGRQHYRCGRLAGSQMHGAVLSVSVFRLLRVEA